MPARLKVALGKQRVGNASRFASEAGLVTSVNAQTKAICDALRSIIDQFVDVTPEMMVEALQPTFEKTQEQVPVDTGALKESGYLQVVQRGGQPQVEIGYGYNNSPPYTQLVHEDITRKHKSPTKAKFLQDPVMEDLDDIYRRLGASYKAFFGT